LYNIAVLENVNEVLEKVLENDNEVLEKVLENP
jgi:hypothetical protein